MPRPAFGEQKPCTVQVHDIRRPPVRSRTSDPESSAQTSRGLGAAAAGSRVGVVAGASPLEGLLALAAEPAATGGVAVSLGAHAAKSPVPIASCNTRRVRSNV